MQAGWAAAVASSGALAERGEKEASSAVITPLYK